MPPIRFSSSPVFLGIAVQPKTKAPVYIQRRASASGTVEIMALAEVDRGDAGISREYVILGDGYLNTDREYAGPTDVTGYPRSHTPRGVTERGGGFGTCLYTGLVLLATAQKEGEIFIGDLIGSGKGICSEENTRSESATRWWRAALERGITTQMDGETGQGGEDYETEENEDEDVLDYVSRRDWDKIRDMISEAVMNHSDWSTTNLSIRADLQREVPSEGESESITADLFTYASAEKHKLVAVRNTFNGTMPEWSRNPVTGGTAYKDVILALNVAGEDTLVVAKLALMAKEAGATDQEVTAMMGRNRFGIDIVSRRVLFDRGDQLSLPVVTPERLGGQTGGRTKRVRLPPSSERLPPGTPDPKENPAPRHIVRRNPGTPSASERRDLERGLAELEKRREDLGWNELENLP